MRDHQCPTLRTRLRFGVPLDPAPDRRCSALPPAALSEQCGLDIVGVIEHPGRPAQMESFARLSMVLARTHAITVMSNPADPVPANRSG